jgi:nitrate reductase assembly molybdenum cofactor insertion protein NarJ
LQRWRSGLLSYSDRRLRELRDHYEALLAESWREAREIADLNQELAERLTFQAQQLRDLGVGEVGWVDSLVTEKRP